METYHEDAFHRPGLNNAHCRSGFTQSAAAARARDASQWEQNYNGYYRGYPLEDWYRTDGW